jgi:segregation and condensation protein B
MTDGWRPRPVFPIRGDSTPGAAAFPVRAADDPVAPAPPTAEVDRDREARRAIEAVVLAATEPVEPRVLAELVELPVTRVEQLCTQLAAEYDDDHRGFVLTRVAGGYRFQTHPDLAPYVEHFVLEGQHVRLSGAALETLDIVAYKQPISRGQISAIRGVNVESTLSTLIQRGYVEESGRDPGPGTAVLYGTTTVFLERLGLDSLRDLPPLGDFVPDAGIVEALERGLRLSDDPTAVEETDAPELAAGTDG